MSFEFIHYQIPWILLFSVLILWTLGCVHSSRLTLEYFVNIFCCRFLFYLSHTNTVLVCTTAVPQTSAHMLLLRFSFYALCCVDIYLMWRFWFYSIHISGLVQHSSCVICQKMDEMSSIGLFSIIPQISIE